MTAVLDPVIHAPNRLQMCCMLAGVDDIDFATLREALDVSESVLSKHIKLLDEAGYLPASLRDVAGELGVSLAEALTPEAIAVYAQRATGAKVDRKSVV